MNKAIVSRPAPTIWLSITLLLVLTTLGYLARIRQHPDRPIETGFIITAGVVGAIIILFLFQLKKVTIKDGRIRIHYFLRFKTINASLEAITSISVSLVKANTTSMRAVGMKNGVIVVNILKGKHVLRMNSMYCSNLPAFEDFFRANCADRFSYGTIA